MKVDQRPETGSCFKSRASGPPEQFKSRVIMSKVMLTRFFGGGGDKLV
jgi:hypothetical protein